MDTLETQATLGIRHRTKTNKTTTKTKKDKQYGPYLEIGYEPI